jgi:pimeloyl-ACP methyl ester carboxylesterase
MYFRWNNDRQTYRIFFVDIPAENPVSDDVVVLLHGFPSSSFDWAPMLNKLSGSLRRRVIALDFLGYGFSEKPQPDELLPIRQYSIFTYADCVSALLFHLNLHNKGIHFLGHDVGVSVAQELIARKAFDVRSVCLLNGGMLNSVYRPTLIQRLLALPVIGWIGVRFVVDKTRFSKSFARIFGRKTQPSREFVNACWNLLLLNNGHLRVPSLLYMLSERKTFDMRWSTALVQVADRLLVLNGPADPVSGRHMALGVKHFLDGQKMDGKIAENIDTESCVKLLGADIGHYPQVEDPEAVASEYRRFLQRMQILTEARTSIDNVEPDTTSDGKVSNPER